MNGEELGIRGGYRISITAVDGSPGVYRIVYQERGIQQERGPGGKPKHFVPLEYAGKVGVEEAGAVNWETPPSDDKKTLNKFEIDARKRVVDMHAWLERVNRLINSVRTWAEETDWAAKIVQKPMEDSEIGHYTAPALLLQKDTTRVLLEPVARSAPGAEGVVDLYLMPAYDDIASLYYHGNKWHLHYAAEGAPVVGDTRNTRSKPLSKDSLRQVLEEMKSHAA